MSSSQVAPRSSERNQYGMPVDVDFALNNAVPARPPTKLTPQPGARSSRATADQVRLRSSVWYASHALPDGAPLDENRRISARPLVSKSGENANDAEYRRTATKPDLSSSGTGRCHTNDHVSPRSVERNKATGRVFVW